jgi:hypothetical protein
MVQVPLQDNGSRRGIEACPSFAPTRKQLLLRLHGGQSLIPEDQRHGKPHPGQRLYQALSIAYDSLRSKPLSPIHVEWLPDNQRIDLMLSDEAPNRLPVF